MKVTVDDRLPVRKWGTGSIPFHLKKSPNGAWWGPIMEKGAAKFFGRYENMNGGQTAESLYAMTGMPTMTFDNKKSTETYLWNMLSKYDADQYIMTAGCVDNKDG
jgi:hypothetical protein